MLQLFSISYPWSHYARTRLLWMRGALRTNFIVRICYYGWFDVRCFKSLPHVMHYRQPWQVGSVSVRMVELTLKNGLSAKSPLAFAHFGGVSVSEGRIHEGCRLGESNDFFSNSLLLILHVYILSTFNRHRKAGTQTGWEKRIITVQIKRNLLRLWQNIVGIGTIPINCGIPQARAQSWTAVGWYLLWVI